MAVRECVRGEEGEGGEGGAGGEDLLPLLPLPFPPHAVQLPALPRLMFLLLQLTLLLSRYHHIPFLPSHTAQTRPGQGSTCAWARRTQCRIGRGVCSLDHYRVTSCGEYHLALAVLPYVDHPHSYYTLLLHLFERLRSLLHQNISGELQDRHKNFPQHFSFQISYRHHKDYDLQGHFQLLLIHHFLTFLLGHLDTTLRSVPP